MVCGITRDCLLIIMVSVSVVEAKARLDDLLDSVSRGQEIVINRDDTPVARLVRVIPESKRDLEDVRQAVAGLRALQKSIARRSVGKKKLSWREWKGMINEGRL